VKGSAGLLEFADADRGGTTDTTFRRAATNPVL